MGNHTKHNINYLISMKLIAELRSSMPIKIVIVVILIHPGI